MSNLRITLHTDSGVHHFVVDETADDDQQVSVSLGTKATEMLFEAMWRRGMRPAGFIEPSRAGITINGRPACSGDPCACAASLRATKA